MWCAVRKGLDSHHNASFTAFEAKSDAVDAIAVDLDVADERILAAEEAQAGRAERTGRLGGQGQPFEDSGIPLNANILQPHDG